SSNSAGRNGGGSSLDVALPGGVVASAGRVEVAGAGAVADGSGRGRTVAAVSPGEDLPPGWQPRTARSGTSRSRRFMMGGYPGTRGRCNFHPECNPGAGPDS